MIKHFNLIFIALFTAFTGYSQINYTLEVKSKPFESIAFEEYKNDSSKIWLGKHSLNIEGFDTIEKIDFTFDSYDIFGSSTEKLLSFHPKTFWDDIPSEPKYYEAYSKMMEDSLVLQLNLLFRDIEDTSVTQMIISKSGIYFNYVKNTNYNYQDYPNAIMILQYETHNTNLDAEWYWFIGGEPNSPTSYISNDQTPPTPFSSEIPNNHLFHFKPKSTNISEFENFKHSESLKVKNRQLILKEEFKSIYIISSLGQIDELSATQKQIDLGEFAAGTYIIKALDKSGIDYNFRTILR